MLLKFIINLNIFKKTILGAKLELIIINFQFLY